MALFDVFVRGGSVCAMLVMMWRRRRLFERYGKPWTDSADSCEPHGSAMLPWSHSRSHFKCMADGLPAFLTCDFNREEVLSDYSKYEYDKIFVSYCRYWCSHWQCLMLSHQAFMYITLCDFMRLTHWHLRNASLWITLFFADLQFSRISLIYDCFLHLVESFSTSSRISH